MRKEIQKDDVILPGGLGTVLVNGKTAEITKSISKDGATTLTLSQVVDNLLNGEPKTEDAEFEVIEPKQIENKPQP